MDISEKLRKLPSVDGIISSPHLATLIERHSRERVVNTLRNILESYRQSIMKGKDVTVSDEAIAEDVSAVILDEDAPSIRRVINATGTVIHTNLGRSVLPEVVVEAIKTAATSPVNLEYDLEKGKRGDRDSHLEKLICRLTGAEAATVVNNNAGAVLLVLNTLARRKEVVVSRGELVEIGGAFRIPEIIKASGCRMVEVGTTNRTRPGDFEEAVSDKTGAILKVHTSNYRITGFTESVPLKELVALGGKTSTPVVEDLGSGALIDLSLFGLPVEPVVRDRIEKGADIVTFSGDKLLGGPQAGIIAGRQEIIKKINKNPLKRALRIDKMTVAALEALFRIYLNRKALPERLPILRCLTRPLEELEGIAEDGAERLARHFGKGALIEVRDGFSEIGSGSMPGEEIPTKVVSVRHNTLSPDRLAEIFRKSDPPIIGRIHDDGFLLDVRCVDKGEELVPSDSL